jgi:hypothetical protein
METKETVKIRYIFLFKAHFAEKLSVSNIKVS